MSQTFSRQLFLTRAGFEADLAEELEASLPEVRIRLVKEPGLLIAEPAGQLCAWLKRRGAWADGPCFARESLEQVALLQDLPKDARVEAILRALPNAAKNTVDGENAEHEYWRVIVPDTDAMRPLEALARSLETRLNGEHPGSAGALFAWYVVLLDSSRAALCRAHKYQRAPFPGGVPRLKLPSDAPSRSTLKLEEALLSLLAEKERIKHLRPGMLAVDLGASPGGWTYHMVKRQMRVAAVDNGPMAPQLMKSGRVEHYRVDGFKFAPARSVDWLLCDMVERPLKVATLVARWFEEGWTRRAVVNLKLPMKKRWPQLAQCLSLWRGLDVRVKQLYHDRDEVTALICSK